jgi:hypothetical protein
MITAWVYILLVTILEVVASYLIPLTSWIFRDTLISLLTISSAAVVVLFYMELKYHYRWESLILVTTLFYVADLLMIWTASLVH